MTDRPRLEGCPGQQVRAQQFGIRADPAEADLWLERDQLADSPPQWLDKVSRVLRESTRQDDEVGVDEHGEVCDHEGPALDRARRKGLSRGVVERGRRQHPALSVEITDGGGQRSATGEILDPRIA